MNAHTVVVFASLVLVGVAACTGDESASEADPTTAQTDPSSAAVSTRSTASSRPDVAASPSATATTLATTPRGRDDVFSFAAHDLCDWVTADDVAGFIAAEFDWQGAAEFDAQGTAEMTSPLEDACKWALTSRDGTLGWVYAEVVEWLEPGAVVPYDESLDDPSRLGKAVSDHPDLSDGVVVHNSGYGGFVFWTPPRNEALRVFLSSMGDVGTEPDDYWPRFFGVADRFVKELNWLSNIQHIDYEGGATYLTGTIANFLIAEGTVTTDADGNENTRDGILSYRVVSDDPRVTGDVTGTWNTDRWGTSINDGAMIQWGHAILTNEHGTWEAPYEGAFASPYGDIVTRWWRGSGDYEGLTFYMWIDGSVVGQPHFDWHGIVFPGDSPPTGNPDE